MQCPFLGQLEVPLMADSHFLGGQIAANFGRLTQWNIEKPMDELFVKLQLSSSGVLWLPLGCIDCLLGW